MNRDIKPGTGKSDSGGSRNIIIRDKHGTLYGFKTLERIQETGDSETCYVVNEVHIDMFIAYLLTNWPNHWAVKAAHTTTVTQEMLEDIDREITLTYADAKEIEYWIERMRNDPNAPDPDNPPYDPIP